MRESSDTWKAPSGLDGLDLITGGGLPRACTSLIVGEPGTGKTILSLQTLVHGAVNCNEPGIYVGFEENATRVVANASGFGWNLDGVDPGRLFFLDARISPESFQTGNFDLTGLLVALSAKVKEMGARRIVFDSVDVLLSMLLNPAAERAELYRLNAWIANTNLLGVLTAKVVHGHRQYAEVYDFLPYMADCVINLRHDISDRLSIRTLRVLKYRGSSFLESEFPIIIDQTGMDVRVPQRGDAVPAVFSVERVSTGVDRLDSMLSGGYFRGSSALISGQPGTAKSTLGAAFLNAGCLRGERAVLISFDEQPGEMVRNLQSVNLNLQTHIDAGLLRVVGLKTTLRSGEELLHIVRLFLTEHKPQLLVIDPISALSKTGGPVVAQTVAARLIDIAKRLQITVVCVSLLETPEPEVESTSLQISTIADTWIQLSYMARGGERNRALTIIKSRGTAHSNQVRELTLSSSGVTLADVYTTGGEVLLGTARWEKEQAETALRVRLQADVERGRLELSLREAELTAKMESLRLELEVRRADFTRLVTEQTTALALQELTTEGLRERRHGDEDGLSLGTIGGLDGG